MKRICNINDLDICSVLSLPTEKTAQDLTDSENTTYELAFYMSGSDKVEFCDETIVTTAGTLRFQPKKKKGEKYVITNIEPVESIDIFFETSSELPQASITYQAGDPGELKSLFVKAESVWRKKKPGYINSCRSIFYRILYLIEKNENHPKNSDFAKIAKAVDHIHSHYTDAGFEYSEMAKLCEISESYFRRLFLRCMGMTLTAYVRKMRLEYACELLTSPSCKSIAEVARLSGYEDVFYFSKIFRAEKGVPPSEWKDSLT